MPSLTFEPLRLLTQEERQELHRVKQATSEPLRCHQQAVTLLAVAEGQSRTEVARRAGWRSYETVSKRIQRFHTQGLRDLDDQPRFGRPAIYGAGEKARMFQ